MAKSNVINGIWTRRIAESGHVARTSWRTDVPQSVLADNQIHAAQIILADGTVLHIPMPGLRAALQAAPQRGTSRGPVNFNTSDRTVHGTAVPMSMTGPATASTGAARIRRRWSQSETAWHRDTIAQIAANPALVIGELSATDPVMQVFHNSTFCGSNRLWSSLRLAKRPDVTFVHRSGRRTAVEVEPDSTASVGFVQTADYVFALRTDLRLTAGEETAMPVVEGVLVLAGAARRLRDALGDLPARANVRIINFVEMP